MHTPHAPQTAHPDTTPRSIADWLRLIRAEYRESPGLSLTKPQVQRLWGLDARTCEELLHALVSSQFLRRTARNGYVLSGR